MIYLLVFIIVLLWLISPLIGIIASAIAPLALSSLVVWGLGDIVLWATMVVMVAGVLSMADQSDQSD